MHAIIVPDTHFPWADWKHIDRIIRLVEDERPDVIVQIGDLYDFWSFSRYAKSLSLITPADEIRKGREEAASMWAALQSAARGARCYQLLGNHDDRMLNGVMKKAPEIEAVLDVLDYKSLWRFPGVQTQPDSRTELVLDGIYFQHGHRSKLGDHALYNLAPTVVGHSHRGGVAYFRYRDQILWELNAGYVAWQDSAVMQYTSQKESKSTPGVGLIDEDGPRFIPFMGWNRIAA
jgi:DNA repair exonuclease SbcCD nuclease subunit